LSYRGLASSSGRGRFPSLLHKRGIVFQQTSKLLLHSSALWKRFCSGRHTTFDFSALLLSNCSGFIVLGYSVPDIVMRRRSICRRRTKSIVVFVLYLKNTSWLKMNQVQSYQQNLSETLNILWRCIFRRAYDFMELIKWMSASWLMDTYILLLKICCCVVSTV